MKFQDLYLNKMYIGPYGQYGTSTSTKFDIAAATREFCQRYSATIKTTGKRYSWYAHPIDYFCDPRDADIMRNSATQLNSVPMVEVSMPEHLLNGLIESNHQHQNADRTERELLWRMQDKAAKESFIRSQNEAVRKAYEKYSMLLNLVKDEYL